MAAQGFDRGAVVLAIGGGATSDHAGFVASIYLRGIPFAICAVAFGGRRLNFAEPVESAVAEAESPVGARRGSPQSAAKV